MTTTKYFKYAVVLAVVFTNQAVFAAPIPDSSLIHIEQFETSFADPAFSSNSTDTEFSNTYVTGVEARGNLATGEVGSQAIGSDGQQFQSIVSLYDTLVFDTPDMSSATVSFEFDLQGSLSSTTPFDQPFGFGGVWIYDITGLETWLETGSLFGLVDQVDVAAEASLVTFNTIEINLDNIILRDPEHDLDVIEIPLDLPTNGALHDVSWSVTGSFLADPTRTYGIQIGANAFSDNNSTADFLGTGTFGFTDLAGSSFESGSGVFLSEQVAPVPVPAALWLFGSGLLGMIGIARRKKAA